MPERCQDCGFLIEPVEHDPDPSRCVLCYEALHGRTSVVVLAQMNPEPFDPETVRGWAGL